MSRPEEQLADMLKEYPKLAKQVEYMFNSKGGDIPGWPSDVLLPFGAWMAIQGAYYPDVDPNVPNLQHKDLPIDSISAGLNATSRLAALGTWRYSKGIYQFGNELFDALMSTSLPDTIPMRIFRRLPDWCPYIELPEPINGIYGYYCYLDYEYRSGAWELRISCDRDNLSMTYPLELTEGLSIADSFATYADDSMPDFAKAFLDDPLIKGMIIDDIKPALSLLMYLCQDEPEIDSEREPGTWPERQRPKRVKGAQRLFEQPKVRRWEVGRTLSKSLASLEPAPGSKKSPHLRRAHWHGYWTGAKTEKQTFVYHWIPPLAIAAGERG